MCYRAHVLGLIFPEKIHEKSHANSVTSKRRRVVSELYVCVCVCVCPELGRSAHTLYRIALGASPKKAELRYFLI